MTAWWKFVSGAAASCLGALLAVSSVIGAEIVVMSSTATRDALAELIPMFERASGHRVVMKFSTAANVVKGIREGAKADLMLTTRAAIDGLANEGKVVPGSPADFARARVGLAVRAGAPKPDIGTPEALKAALLAARSVSYSGGPSGAHFMRMMERLGIADQIKAKSVVPEVGVRIGTLVAKGEAEMGLQQINELLPVPGIDFVGPLPEELQARIAYATATPLTAMERDGASALSRFLSSPAAVPVLKKLGLDPA